MCDLAFFLKEFSEEATKRNLFDDQRVSVDDWLEKLTQEYDNYYTIWNDYQRVFVKLVAIYDLLFARIGSKIITLTTFFEFLEITDDHDLKSTWYDDTCKATIELLLDTFELCLTDDEPHQIQPY